MSIIRIASRYAKSLIDLSIESNNTDRVYEDILAFKKALENRDLFLLLKSPIIKTDKKERILQLLFEDHFLELTNHFFKIVTEKGREEILSEIADQFIVQYKELRRISTVYLTTAVDLSPETVERIRSILEESHQTYENVELIAKVDPGIMGGFVIKFDSKLYDASVQHKLDGFRKQFSSNLYTR